MQAGEIRDLLEKHNIQRVKLGAFDIDSTLRGKYVSTEKFLSAAQSGLGFCDVIFGWDIGDVLYDNAKFTGWHTGYPDANCRIALDTFRMIPWEPAPRSSCWISSPRTGSRCPLRHAKCSSEW